MFFVLFACIQVAAADLIVIPLDKESVPVRRGESTIYKTAYFGNILVGSSSFSVVFDTGSGHVFVPSTRCESASCQQHQRYNETTASKEEVSLSFGTGEVVGSCVEEAVCLSTSSCATMKLVAAHSMTDEPFQSFRFDGVVGLGLEGLAVGRDFSFFGQMAAQTSLAQFGYFISDRQGVSSEIAFGGADPRHMRSGLRWAPVHEPQKGFWQLKVLRLTVNGEELPFCSEGCVAIADTGTSLLGAPRAAAQQLHRHLARVVHPEPVDCRDVDGPELTFHLENGVSITLGGREYSRPAPMKVTNKKQETQAVCRATLLPVDETPSLGAKAFILGEPMMRKYYTVYDWEKQRVGFALSGGMDAVHV